LWTASSDRDGKERAQWTKILCRADARIRMDRGTKRHRPAPEHFTGYSGQHCPRQTGEKERRSAVGNSQQNSFYEKNLASCSKACLHERDNFSCNVGRPVVSCNGKIADEQYKILQIQIHIKKFIVSPCIS
jgi:hypothetical protein